MAALLKRGFQILLIGLLALFSSTVPADVKAPGKGVGNDDRRPPKDENMEYREEMRIPLPIKLQGKVLRGRSITFLLETVEDLDAQEIQYSIRSFPKAGQLSEIKPLTNRLSAVEVVYTPDPDREVAFDSFTYSARYPRGRTSAPVEVRIEVATPQPVLQLPPNIHFGPVLVGQSGTVEIPIKNIGNDFFEGSLDMFGEGSRWSWVPKPDEPVVRLEPEEETMATFQFSPKAPGVATTRASLTPGFEGAEAMLTAEGVIPFALDRTKVDLVFDPVTRRRTAMVKALPRSREAFQLTFEGDERLQLPRGDFVQLNPGRGEDIPIELPATDPMPFDGVLTIVTDGFKREIKLRGAPTPALLGVELSNTVSTQLDLGTIEPGEEAVGEFGVRNYGGVPKNVEFSLPPPFELEEEGETFEIAPNSIRQFRVWFRPEKLGVFRETVQLSPANQQLTVKLRGAATELVAFEPPEPRVFTPPTVPGIRPGTSTTGASRPGNTPPGTSPGITRPGPNAGGSPVPSSSGGTGSSYSNAFRNRKEPPTLTQLENRQAMLDRIPTVVRGEAGKIALPPSITRDRLLAYSPFKTKTDIELPMIEKFNPRNVFPESIELIWPRPGGHEEFEVEARITKFNPDSKRYECIWFPLQEVEYKLNEEVVIATINGLQPDTFYMFRVFSMGPGGTNSLPSLDFGVRTAPPPSRAGLAGILAIVGVVLIVVLGFGIYMRRAGLL